MAEELYFDEYTGRCFKSTKGYVDGILKNVNDKLKGNVEDVKTKGAITIPRGLSDEEVLAAYHDKAENERITNEIIERAKYEAIRDLYNELGIPFDFDLECWNI